MTRCSSCHENWSASSVLKRYTAIAPGMACPSCGQMQYLSEKYRKRSLMAMLLIPLLMLIPAFFDISIAAMSLLIIAGFAAIAVIHLFTIELTGEDGVWRRSLVE
ncbi:TIGR04104 family putative zinc finger protein [Salinicoccus hispanicus]|uniref:CXXC-20-CXXC protein n=1 Tax=Salinicoccus hispanicus TaxID=157225 RepID=A0A6N8TWS6_9STAP|nr:TIGR04104 family putative zinc finger protein [Salinicoccus hispanicus]MXQ50153.1 hypothetical protein [Salinicoccus hispanicus]